jgi:hypothetical protein
MVSSVDGLAGAAAVGRQVPPQRREVASEAATGAWGEQALDFTPDEQASQPPDISFA